MELAVVGRYAMRSSMEHGEAALGFDKDSIKRHPLKSKWTADFPTL
jgi:hypothetical protein